MRTNHSRPWLLARDDDRQPGFVLYNLIRIVTPADLADNCVKVDLLRLDVGGLGLLHGALIEAGNSVDYT